MYTLQAGAQHAIAFDTTQITSKTNRSQPKAGDACHPVTAEGHAPAIAYQTSGNCGAWETGDITGALDTNTDPNSHVICFSGKDYGADAGELAPTLRAMGHAESHANAGGQLAVAFNITPSNSNKDFNARETQRAQALTAQGGAPSARGGDVIVETYAVRRLTPLECERLQGAPDDYTNIAYRGRNTIADGPRYKMIGNSWAVPCVRWIGERLALVDDCLKAADQEKSGG